MGKVTANSRALVVFSGGQDSTTTLGWALQKFDYVELMTFDYGQRHKIELKCAKKIASSLKLEHTTFKINTFSQLGGNALVDDRPIKSKRKGIPNTFVPGRNLIFFTYAAAFAYQRDIDNIVTGISQTDYSGYPDCRMPTINALQKSLNLGMEKNFKIHAPLSGKTKAQTVKMAKRYGVLSLMEYTHTCYEGVRPGCMRCPACKLRQKGFKEAGIADPLFVN